MSRDIWIISDTHFNHSNILKFKDKDNKLIRGSKFTTVKDMDQYMIDKWNSVVKDNDIVYHLGDVYFNASKPYIENILRQLKGRKRLILGNHDNGKDQILQKYFQKVLMWRLFSEFGLLLTHVPVHPSNLKIYVKKENYTEGDVGDKQELFVNVHGHIHQNKSPDGPYFNACVEHTDYTPIHIDSIRKLHV